MNLRFHFLHFAKLNVLRQTKRSIFVFATIFIGILGFVLFDSFNEGIMIDYRNILIRGIQGNGHLYTKGYYEKKPNPLHSGWIENSKTVRAELEQNKFVQGAFPRVRFSAFLTQGKQNITAIGQGIDTVEERKFFNSLIMREGVSLNGEADGILLGEGLASALQRKVGDTVTVLAQTFDGRLNGADMKVVGVFATGASSLDDVFFFLPISVAQTLLDSKKVEYFSIGLYDINGWKNFINSLSKELKNSFDFVAFEEMDKFYYENSIKFLSNQFYLMGSIFTLIVILGVANSVSIQVFQRRAEISTYFINGQTPAQTTKLFVLESVFISIFAYISSIIVSFILVKFALAQGVYMPPAPGFKNPYYAKLHFSFMRASLLALVPLIAAIATTFFMARQASKKLFTFL
jgi:putative ABC transport system permease protein